MNVLTEKLAILSSRERFVLLGGGLLTLCLILYALAWQPWQNELNRLRAQIPAKEETLAWMRAQAAQVEVLSARSKRGADQSGLPLLTLIERSANQVEIREAITRMSPGEKEDQVRIWMDNADFDRWLRWLKTLDDSGIEVAEANIDRSVENQVSIRTTLQR